MIFRGFYVTGKLKQKVSLRIAQCVNKTFRQAQWLRKFISFVETKFLY